MSALPFRRWHSAVLVLVALLAVASTRASAQPGQPLIAYLGNLDCHATTGLGGDDQLGAAYGVFVEYTDGTYRTWGGYLYRGDVNENWALGPQTDRPLFIYRPNPPSLPTEIDVTSPGKTVEYLRVTIVLYEDDQPFEFPISLHSHGLGGDLTITRRLRNGRWRELMRMLRGDGKPSFFSERVFLAAREHYESDLIGYNEYKFTRAELENPERATQISSSDEVSAHRTRNPGRDVSYHFTSTGEDSFYTGALWLVQGPASEMNELLTWADPRIILKRFTRRVYVMIRNTKDVPVTFTLAPPGPIPRRELREQIREIVPAGVDPVTGRTRYEEGDLIVATRVDPATGLPLYAMRNTLIDVLQPGAARVYSLESPEDELLFHFNVPTRPQEEEFVGSGLLIQPTARLRHFRDYYIIAANDLVRENPSPWDIVRPSGGSDEEIQPWLFWKPFVTYDVWHEAEGLGL